MLTTQEKAQNLADGLAITVWITEDGRIVQNKPKKGGTAVRPGRWAKPTPHGSPAEHNKSASECARIIDRAMSNNDAKSLIRATERTLSPQYLDPYNTRPLIR
jgi:hypothetical protein